MNLLRLFLLLVVVSLNLTLNADTARADCSVVRTAPVSTEFPENDDLLTDVLRAAPTCPQNVFELRDALAAGGVRFLTTLVANRGFHNQEAGSFSFFEMAGGAWNGRALEQGEFFFGHFVELEGGVLTAQQTASPRALLVELIAWDARKELFNFYELRGTGYDAIWYYRGDTDDIRADNRYLHLPRPEGAPMFGSALRCSACHGNGGPIMKELEAPHNDWWTTKRPLPVGGVWEPRLYPVLSTLVDASVLAKAVEVGEKRLFAGARGLPRTLQERLRPLFCPVELNLASAKLPADASAPIDVPTGFWQDPRLGPVEVSVSKEEYAAALAQYNLQFPESNRADADHPWLTPVKAASDRWAIDAVVKKGTVKIYDVANILAIDAQEPVFSAVRCSLLQSVPEMETPGWRDALRETIARVGTTWRAPRESGSSNVDIWIKRLMTRRAAVAQSEISQNPLGQILEPGFRLIFPVETADEALETSDR